MILRVRLLQKKLPTLKKDQDVIESKISKNQLSLKQHKLNIFNLEAELSKITIDLKIFTLN